MLELRGPATRYCDGVTRRSLLKIGAFSFGAFQFGLADVLRAEPGQSRRHKAVINILLAGGPPHQDMFDIKTEAPVEIRGEFQPIATSVPGIQIGESFPRLAALMHKSVVVRSVVEEPSREKFDHWYATDHFPEALTGLKPQKGWRFWSGRQ